MDDPQQHDEAERQSNRGKWILIGFLVVAAFFLWTEHRAHVLGALPYLLILACPLMHLFHHSQGHGHHKSSDARENHNARHTEQQAGEKS